MGSASRLGMTEPSTVESGERIEPMVKVALSMSMAMSMTATGQMTRPMAVVSTST